MCGRRKRQDSHWDSEVISVGKMSQTVQPLWCDARYHQQQPGWNSMGEHCEHECVALTTTMYIQKLGKKKNYLQGSEKDHLLYSTIHTHTCIQAGRTTYCTEQHGPATLLYLTHTNPPAHMPFISTVFKVPRTGNHYESMLLTATLRDEKPCVCHTSTTLQLKPKKTLLKLADEYK